MVKRSNSKMKENEQIILLILAENNSWCSFQKLRLIHPLVSNQCETNLDHLFWGKARFCFFPTLLSSWRVLFSLFDQLKVPQSKNFPSGLRPKQKINQNLQQRSKFWKNEYYILCFWTIFLRFLFLPQFCSYFLTWNIVLRYVSYIFLFIMLLILLTSSSKSNFKIQKDILLHLTSMNASSKLLS